MKIYFRGLMTHALLPPRENPTGTPSERVVVVYNAHGHTARLWVPRSDDAGTYDCHLITGEVSLSFPAAAAATPPSDVPHLEALMPGGTINPEILDRDSSNDFKAFVALQGGAYSVADYFRWRGEFDDEVPRCIPRTLLWERQSSTAITITDEGGLNQTVDGAATLFIANLPPQGQPDPPQHFDHYRAFKTGLPSIDRPVQLTEECNEQQIESVLLPECATGPEEPAVTTVECSNTQFP
jgi:hypothetical protein